MRSSWSLSRRHWDPHQVLGAHAVNDGVVVPRLPARRAGGARASGGRGVRHAPPASSGGAVRGACAWCQAASALRVRGDLPGRRRLYVARSLRVRAHDRGPRSTPSRGGAPRGAIRAAGGSCSGDRWCARYSVRGVGAGGAGSECGGRLQFLGRPFARDAGAGGIGGLGALHSGGGGGRCVQVRDPYRGRRDSA